MPTTFPLARRRSSGPAWVVVVLMLTLMLRFLPVEALDGMAPAPAAADRTVPAWESESFPGSAYFHAEDVFAPVDAAPSTGAVTLLSGTDSAHVLQIEHGPAALSMPMRGLTSLDQARALLCLTNALYYEAGNEPEEGQRAIAQVILNRLASGRWPDSVCAVVYQGGERADRGCQFTFSCDGSMARLPNAAAWTRARRVAARALGGEVFAPAGLATFYHSLAVRPAWAERMRSVAVIGAHIFYRLPGEAGAPAGYRMRYSGREFAQPGPYAFTPPPSPLPLPAGPEVAAVWSEPMAPVVAPVRVPSPPSIAASPMLTPPSLPRDTDVSGLPQSTIRPEYRNTGRPLH